jgi:hypothetical protein
VSTPLNLYKIWPKQGWSEHINDERTDDIIKQLDEIYTHIRMSPRDNEGDISNEQWVAAYEHGLIILKALFRKTTTITEALTMNQRLAERLLLDYEQLATLPLCESYHYWALSQMPLTSLGNNAFEFANLSENLTDNAKE